MSLDPLKTTAYIRESYFRYLRTAFPLKNGPLAEQFARALVEPKKFIKGPYLEATPPFRPGASLEQLISEKVLVPEFRKLDGVGLPLTRPLYMHQESAVQKAVKLGRNLVLATGTGSGKTECFLIPVLNHLFREKVQGVLGPGVRALLLYPMNALANDQLKRLRRLLAPYPAITFGRYTGETKESKREAQEHFRKNYPQEPRIANELLSREEMRSSPPHLLLTNYAMLEYLLLRPKDCEFFEGRHAGQWHFLVLDEIHAYNGAVGIEMAMLLRRLKERVVRSQTGRLQCIGTSATLGRGRQDSPDVVSFAHSLFDERFEWVEDEPDRQDVIEAERIPLEALGQPWGEPYPGLYSALQHMLEADTLPSTSHVTSIARDHAVPEKVIADACNAWDQASGDSWVRALLHRLLAGDGRLHRLRQRLAEKGPAPLEDLPQDMGAVAPQALIALVDLAARARADADTLPLLPARYHVFVRALEGAYVCLASPPTIRVDRCETIMTPGGVLRFFEASTCKRCGQLYLVGRVENDTLLHPRTLADDNRDEPQFFRVLETGQLTPLLEDEDQEVSEGEESANRTEGVLLVCAVCGTLQPEHGLLPPSCRCASSRPQWRRIQQMPTRERQVNHCPACGSRSPGIVTRFLTGQDAPASVLATALYQSLPAGNSAPAVAEEVDDDWRVAATTSSPEVPGGGRKLLLFSDSRQDAAFFACYLDRTYEQILRRRLIVHALERHPEAAREHSRLHDLVPLVRQVAEEQQLFARDESLQERNCKVWTWLVLELLAYDWRNSLEGLGIVAFEPVTPDEWQAPRPLTQAPWSLSPEEGRRLYQILLQSFRLQGAITFPEGLSPTEEIFAPRNREYFFRNDGANPRRAIFSWGSPAKGKQNRRLDFLRKLYRRTTGTEPDDNSLRQLLNNIWKNLTSIRDYLRDISLQGEGVVYRYNHKLFQLAGWDSSDWWRCDRCGNVSWLNLRGICPHYGCEGELRACNPALVFEQNHYAQLYRGLEPIRMLVAEHTAQLTSEAAAELQDKFVRNEVNVLSCSTTFELGVDVGELEAVFLRNVPPETANYVQRAGRAGRRTESTAFALTFCQRRSHDLNYFQQPERMIAGTVRPPQVEVANDKIVRRHVQAVALGWFFQRRQKFFGRVQTFFFPEQGGETGTSALRQILHERPVDLQDSLLRIVPSALHDVLGLRDWQWLGDLLDEKNGVLARAEVAVKEDIAKLEEEYQKRTQERKPADHILRAINTIKNEELIGFLANHNVLPKYGFPVDVVELKLHGDEARQLELERDLRIAISEYAPDGEVVAGGYLWASRAIKRVANLEWPKFHYAVCDACGRYHRSRFETDEPPETCSCGAPLSEARKHGKFLVPLFGFQTDAAEKPRRPTEARPERTYSSRVFFAQEGQAIKEFTHNLGDLRLHAQFSRKGTLAVINRSGFWVCEQCGFGTRAANPGDHKAPWVMEKSRKCRGTLRRWDLGHEFSTDLLDLRWKHVAQAYPDQFWLSLLYAVLEGASAALDIRRQDLDGCLYPYGGPASPPALVLFDDVPGGAGHARRIGQKLLEVLRAARDRVDGRCGCGGGQNGPGDTSCYGCLRNYRNQWAHEAVSRGQVYSFLDGLLG